MYCPHCGHEISDDAKYCPDCGARIYNTKQEANKFSNAAQEAKNTANEYKRRYRHLSRKAQIIVTGLAVILIVVIVIAATSFSRSSSPEKHCEEAINSDIEVSNLLNSTDDLSSDDLRNIIYMQFPETVAPLYYDMCSIILKYAQPAVTAYDLVYDLESDYGSERVELEKINKLDKLSDLKLQYYQNMLEQIGKSGSESFGDIDLKSIEDEAGMPADVIQQAMSDWQEFCNAVANLKVTDGYTVDYSYFDFEDGTDYDDEVVVICVDKKWLVMEAE